MPQYDLVVYNNKTCRDSELPAAKAIFVKLAKLSDSLTSVLPVDKQGSCTGAFWTLFANLTLASSTLRFSLLHKQFKNGMKWEKLAADPDIGKIKCMIGQGGIKFVDINLDSVSAGNFGEDISQEFRDWLDFLGCTPSKTAHDIAAVKTTGVQQAYKVIADLPSDVFVQYQEEIMMVRT
eukprot:3672990-Rhodomonas_salina.1